MTKQFVLWVLFTAGLFSHQPVLAAPMDELIMATHATPEIEIGYEQVNSTVDIFKIREKDPLAAGTSLGDYSGAHLTAGIPLLERRAWLEGGLWQRKLNIANLGSENARIQSWSLSGQYRIAAQLGNLPDLALRLGAWGDAADSVSKDSPTTFNTFTVSQLQVVNPRDRQLQGDLVTTWGAGKMSSLSLFAGLGSSAVDFDLARAFQGGCEYAVTSQSSSQILMDTQSPGCDSVLIQNPGPFPAKYNTNNFRYRANSFHFGGGDTWMNQRWRIRLAYRHENIRRALDDEIAASGGLSSKSNNILTGELGYRLTQGVGLVVRGHYFSRQLNGEIPFTYNALTSDKFNHRYGLLTTALVFEFE